MRKHKHFKLSGKSVKRGRERFAIPCEVSRKRSSMRVIKYANGVIENWLSDGPSLRPRSSTSRIR